MGAARLRGEKDAEWVPFRAESTPSVRDMQTALRAAGFLPAGQANGILDYRTVSAALNSGVPLAMTGNSELASQFDSLTRKMLKVSEPDEPQRRSTFGLQRIASMW